jgi:hypothetical protein
VLGKAMADFRRITSDFRVQIEDEMREMERHTRVQQTAPAEASPYHPTDPELLGAVPATSVPDSPATPAPLTPAEVPPPPAGFTGAPEPAAPAPATPTPATAASVTSATATVPEKPADGESHSA